MTSVEVIVTSLVPVARVPVVVGVIGTETFPLVVIDKDVWLPYGTAELYFPVPYG